MITITNIYQSERLHQLGVPASAADFAYIKQDGKDILVGASTRIALASKNARPAWSMGRLLEIMPTPPGVKFSIHVNDDDSWTCLYQKGDLVCKKTRPHALTAIYEVLCELLWKGEIKISK